MNVVATAPANADLRAPLTHEGVEVVYEHVVNVVAIVQEQGDQFSRRSSGLDHLLQRHSKLSLASPFSALPTRLNPAVEDDLNLSEVGHLKVADAFKRHDIHVHGAKVQVYRHKGISAGSRPSRATRLLVERRAAAAHGVQSLS